MAPIISMYLFLQTLPSRTLDRLRDERGQTAAEYLGIIVVISVIVATLFASQIDETIRDNVITTITNIFNGTANGG